MAQGRFQGLGIGVVRIVDQDDALGQGDPLAPLGGRPQPGDVSGDIG